MPAPARHETRALLRAHLSAASSLGHLTRHCPVCHRLLRLAMDSAPPAVERTERPSRTAEPSRPADPSQPVAPSRPAGSTERPPERAEDEGAPAARTESPDGLGSPSPRAPHASCPSRVRRPPP
ncbi:DUF6274 family protein [Streptomyces prasinus]|uniref:DUF6274 family protein n=1 Tax=Streptomyces prasinus TaxID=67345 RepID=UPI00332927C4